MGTPQRLSPLLKPEEARTSPDYFDSKIGKNAFYDALRDGGDLHDVTMRLGRRLFIIRAKLDAKLRGKADEKSA